MNQEEKKKFGKALKEARIKKDLSQFQCAMHCGVSIVSYQNWERGVCEPQSEKKKLICKFLGVENCDWENDCEYNEEEVNAMKLERHGTKVECIETGETFKSCKKAAVEKLGNEKMAVSIRNCVNGKTKQAGGLHWRKC